MNITDEMIDQAAELGACSTALYWLTSKPRTVEELIEHGEFVDFCFEHGLVPSEYIDAAVEACPRGALEYYATTLSPAQFAKCIQREPGEALYSCAHMLTDEQFIECAKIVPEEAWDYSYERCLRLGLDSPDSL